MRRAKDFSSNLKRISRGNEKIPKNCKEWLWGYIHVLPSYFLKTFRISRLRNKSCSCCVQHIKLTWYNLDSKYYFISTWVKTSYFFVTFKIISKCCVSTFNCLAVNMISLIFLTKRRVRTGFHLQLAGLSGYNMLTLMTMLFIFGLPQLYDTYTSVVYPIIFPIT